MANFVRNDSSEFTGHAAGQTPIVLARLPRVGAALPAVPASPATLQVVPPPEAMPQLDLRTEIDQRIKLHVADSPADQAPTTSHFADRRHAVDHKPTVRQSSPAPIARETVAKTQARVGEPITFSEKVFQLHAQLAPHAGLIVALALIASAGLLYWMIVGPTQAPMPTSYETFSENTSENFDPKLSGEGDGVASNYVPEFTVDVPQPVAPESTNDQWTEVQLPVPPQDETPSPLAFPEAEPVTLQKLPPAADEPLFPETGRPHALKFSILEQPATRLSQPASEVAQRPITSTNR